MRAFVAVEVPEGETLARILAFQRELEATGADLKIVEKENLHFTIKFLGEITPSQADEADRRLKALSLQGGEAEARGAGAFPSSSRPNVVWVGVAGKDVEAFNSIAKKVIESLAGIGESDSRGFQAHLTVARVRSGKNREDLAAAIRTYEDASFGPLHLRNFKLKSSQLTPRGPIYADVGVYALA